MTAPTIDVCIPAIGAGARYVTFFVRNALALAQDPSRVRFVVSHHAVADREKLEPAFAAGGDVAWLPVPAASYTHMFYPSANHSRAVNALVAHSTADVVLIVDHDMAFLVPGWDRLICDDLQDGRYDLFGTAYPTLASTIPKKLLAGLPAVPALVAWILHGMAMKYQHLPNLSFLAIPRRIVERCFPDGRITAFDDFLLEGNLPFRLINTSRLAAETNLSKGTMQWLDTGYELTEHIAEHGLRCKSLPMRPWTTTEVFRDRSVFGPIAYSEQPEIYDLDGAPFLAHFRKGSVKADSPERADRFGLFEAAVEAYVASGAPAAPGPAAA